MPPRKMTLDEVARRAGVSRSTASRALNGHPRVRPEVRARVEAIVAETGYQINSAARALASSKSDLIGLVMPNDAELFADPYYPALITGIQEGCLDLGLSLGIFPLLAGVNHPDAVSKVLTQGFVDGLVVTAGPWSDSVLSTLRKRVDRIVVVGRPLDPTGLLQVAVDNRGGAIMAVEHLFGLGHRRIAFIGPTAMYTFGIDRLDGYRAAHVAAGVDVDERLLRFDVPTADGGRRAAAALVGERPDAIFAATDAMARGVLELLAAEGLAVPGDVAVVGFDGVGESSGRSSTLTTVVQPVVELGHAAVAMVLDDDDAPSQVVLSPTLHVGSSSGRARSDHR